jgi:hypothetical protein
VSQNKKAVSLSQHLVQTRGLDCSISIPLAFNRHKQAVVKRHSIQLISRYTANNIWTAKDAILFFKAE